MVMGCRVRAPHTAFAGAGPQGFIDDLADGAGTTAAFGAAAKASINLTRRTRQIARDGDSVSDIVVSQDVAGTNDHGRERKPQSTTPFRY